MANKLGNKTNNEKVAHRVIKGLVASGHTMEQVAKMIGVCKKTLYNWINKDPELLHEVQEARELANGLVEAALFKAAMGFEYEEDKAFLDKEGEVIKTKVKRKALPNVGAQRFWLTNTDSDTWREKKEVEHTGEVRSITDLLIESESEEVDVTPAQIEGSKNDE